MPRVELEPSAYAVLVECAPTMIWRANVESQFDYFNATWLDFRGRTLEQEVGQGWAHGVHPEDLERCVLTYLVNFDKREPFEMEYRLARHDGVYRWIYDRGVPFSKDGEFAGFIGSCIDVHDRVEAAAMDAAARREADEERARLLASEQQARHEAERSNRLKDEFLATVSHELRTPLQSILGWVKLLRDRKLSPDRFTKAVEVIERNAKAQAQLIEDILDVSRVITGKLRLSAQTVDVASIVANAVETMRPAADAKGIELRSHASRRAGAVVGDPDRLQQAVWNLISNAVKFTPSGGRIDVRASAVDQHVEIVVADTGKGIDESLLPFVFDRFWQADMTTNRSQGGLGLGLALARHLVELHGGTVHAESGGVGRGATFSIRLPRRRLTDQPEPAAIEAEEAMGLSGAAASSLAGVRVLVVDDEQDARDLLVTVLQGYGAQPRPVASAAEAMAAMDEFRPDIIVSDIGMPREDGYELIRRVREREREKGTWTPAVALTAYARVEERRKALAAGFQLHVAKPIDPKDLAATLSSLLA